MRSHRKNLNDKTARTELNFHLLDDLIENVIGIEKNISPTGRLNKNGLVFLKDAVETYQEIDHREDTEHINDLTR